MKKNLLLFLLFSFTVGALLAQSTFKNRLSFGIEAGPQFNSVRNGGLMNPKGSIAANVGVFVQYDISHSLNLSLGANYDPRGFETSARTPFLVLSDTGYIGYNSYYAYDMTYKIDYLTIPLNFTYLSSGNKFRLLVEGGVYFSIALKSHQKGYQGIYVDSTDLPHYGDSTLTAGFHMTNYDSSAANFFNPVDFGFHFAFGLVYEVSDKMAITFKPGFNFGMTSIVSSPDVNLKWDRILKLNVGIVYKFHPYVKPKNEYILQ